MFSKHVFSKSCFFAARRPILKGVLYCSSEGSGKPNNSLSSVKEVVRLGIYILETVSVLFIF